MPRSPLDDLPCFSIYTAARAVMQAYRAVLREFDLTYPQFLVLAALYRAGEQSIGELGEAMGLDSGTLSPLVRRLESRGLVTRARRADDERVVTVALTDQARTLSGQITAQVDCLGPAYGMDLDQLGEVIESMRTITDGMTQLTASLRTPSTATAA